MHRHRVESLAIRSVGYDPLESILEIEFINGDVYQYYGVPELEYNELMSAESKGQFVNLRIKEHYAYAAINR